MASDTDILDEVTGGEYKYGFVTNIEADNAPIGLDENTIRFISAKKNEPAFMLEYRLKAFAYWKTMKEPNYWAHLNYPKIDFQNIIYYSAPKQAKQLQSLDEVDPELLKTFEKLGISLEEQKRISGVESRIAIDAVIDSVSVKTTFKETLAEKGIIFCYHNFVLTGLNTSSGRSEIMVEIKEQKSSKPCRGDIILPITRGLIFKKNASRYLCPQSSSTGEWQGCS